MRKLVLLQMSMVLFFVIGSCAVSAQGDYIVTIKRDTLRGEVKYFSNSGIRYTGSSKKYVQLTPLNGKKSTHEVLQTLAFRMDDEIYHTVKSFEGYTFMKLIKAGYLSLYSYQMENQTTWDGRYFVKKDGTFQDVPNIGFKKKLPRFLEDCPTVIKDIESGVLGRSDLIKMTEQYNACIDLKTGSGSTKKSPATEVWEKLENEVKGLPEFDKKADAIEMIRDIQNKLSKNEKIPSFLLNGLKDALKDQSSVTVALGEAFDALN